MSFLCSTSTSPSSEPGSNSGVPMSTQTRAWTHAVPADNSPTRSPCRENAVDAGLCLSEAGGLLLLCGAQSPGAAAALGRKAGRGGEGCPHDIPTNNAVEGQGGHTSAADEGRDVRERVLWRQGGAAAEPGPRAGLASPLLTQPAPPFPGPEGSGCVLGGQERAEHQHKARCSHPSTCSS